MKTNELSINQGAVSMSDHVTTGVVRTVDERAQRVAGHVDAALDRPVNESFFRKMIRDVFDGEERFKKQQRLRVIADECDARARQLAIRSEAIEQMLKTTLEGLQQVVGTRIQASVVRDVVATYEQMMMFMNTEALHMASEVKPQVHQAAELLNDPLMADIGEQLIQQLKGRVIGFFELCTKKAADFEALALSKIRILETSK